MILGFGKKRKVPVKHQRDGNHNDHWGAIFGYEDSTRERIEDVIMQLEHERKLSSDSVLLRAQYGMLSALGIQKADKLHTLYPAYFTSDVVPVTIKSIGEWAHVGGIEGNVVGNGRNTFMLEFFATDYVRNHKRYKAGGTLNIALAGIAYVVKDAEPFADEALADVCSYMPNSEVPGGSNFDFVAEINSTRSLNLNSEKLVLLDVKMLSDGTRPNLFNLPMLANPKNMGCSSLQPGKRISGCLWLQGRILG